MRKTLFAALPLLLATLPAQAEDSELAPFRACVGIKDQKDRLVCFDKAAAGIDTRRAEVVAREQAAQEARVAAAREQAARDFGLPKGRHSEVATPDDSVEQKEARAIREAHDEPDKIEAAVVTFSRTPTGRIVVVLDNGQVWVEADGSHFNRDIKPGTIATLRPRFISGYRLTVPKINQGALVTRVR